jgi:hypothetical protein
MIRRGFWLAVGAAGGIMGYRRATALGRRVSGSLGGQRAPAAGRHAASRRTASRSLARDAIRATRAVRGFSRDVREGRELYMARRPRPVPPTLPAKPNDVTAKDDR